ncbi:MAG: LamB/YcsF family protein [Mycobacteriales bacterium]
MGTIDLNADLGEGFGNYRMGDDEALLGIVTSASVACGFHAGDPLIMRRVCATAATNGVAVGAHVSYRDLAGFGRRPMHIAPEELAGDVLYQLGALQACAKAAGTTVAYVKAHGALYNTIAVDPDQAGAVVSAVCAFAPGLPVLGLPGSAFLTLAATAGLRPVTEAFADRAYDAGGHLVPRARPGSVLHDADEIAARCVLLATERRVTAADGTDVVVDAGSICVHGDTPGAVAIATRVRAALGAAGVRLAPFTP